MGKENGSTQNPEIVSSGIVTTVPLDTLIKVIYNSIVNPDEYLRRVDPYFLREDFFRKRAPYLLTWEIKDDGDLNFYVTIQEEKALNSDEANLIRETAIVVHKTVEAVPPPKDPTRLAERIKAGGAYPFSKAGRLTTKIAEDIVNRTVDKNTIYVLIQQDMGRLPGLALFVATQMSKSVSLEEANLIGQTALVVYKARELYLSTVDWGWEQLAQMQL